MGFFSNFISRKKGRSIYVSGSGTSSRPRDGRIQDDAICTAIIDTNSTHIARGQVLHVVRDDAGRMKLIKRSSEYSKLFARPNPMMTARDFLYAMSWQLHVTNTAFAWIKWDARMKPVEIWPLCYLRFQIVKLPAGYGVQIYDTDGQSYVVGMEDLVVVRSHYDGSGYAGRSNAPVSDAISMEQSIDESLLQAMRVSNKIHGLFRQKNAMLATKSAEEAQNDFSRRMSKAAEVGGVVSLDATEEYTPLTVSTWSANALQAKQITDRIYTYWRTPEEVVRNTASEQVIMNYFDSVVEPVWDAMGQAFTKALFTAREQDFGNCIVVSAGAATGASWATRLNIINSTKELGLLTKNQYLELLSYPPAEDGDEAMVSLNYVKASDQSLYQVGKDEGNNDE